MNANSTAKHSYPIPLTEMTPANSGDDRFVKVCGTKALRLIMFQLILYLTIEDLYNFLMAFPMFYPFILSYPQTLFRLLTGGCGYFVTGNFLKYFWYTQQRRVTIHYFAEQCRGFPWSTFRFSNYTSRHPHKTIALLGVKLRHNSCINFGKVKIGYDDENQQVVMIPMNDNVVIYKNNRMLFTIRTVGIVENIFVANMSSTYCIISKTCVRCPRYQCNDNEPRISVVFDTHVKSTYPMNIVLDNTFVIDSSPFINRTTFLCYNDQEIRLYSLFNNVITFQKKYPFNGINVAKLTGLENNSFAVLKSDYSCLTFDTYDNLELYEITDNQLQKCLAHAVDMYSKILDVQNYQGYILISVITGNGCKCKHNPLTNKEMINNGLRDKSCNHVVVQREAYLKVYMYRKEQSYLSLLFMTEPCYNHTRFNIYNYTLYINNSVVYCNIDFGYTQYLYSAMILTKTTNILRPINILEPPPNIPFSPSNYCFLFTLDYCYLLIFRDNEHVSMYKFCAGHVLRNQFKLILKYINYPYLAYRLL